MKTMINILGQSITYFTLAFLFGAEIMRLLEIDKQSPLNVLVFLLMTLPAIWITEKLNNVK